MLLIALTAVTAGEYADRIDAAGFDWLFAKPVAAADLLGAFGEFAAGRARRPDPRSRDVTAAAR